jgi:hypothetical protein
MVQSWGYVSEANFFIPQLSPFPFIIRTLLVSCLTPSLITSLAFILCIGITSLCSRDASQLSISVPKYIIIDVPFVLVPKHKNELKHRRNTIN